MTREALPGRRACETFDFVHGGILYTGSVGFYADGRVGEVFLTATKSGMPLQAIARDAAVVLSIALQHGASLETIRKAVTRDEAGAASGACGALVDALAEVGQSEEPRGARGQSAVGSGQSEEGGGRVSSPLVVEPASFGVPSGLVPTADCPLPTADLPLPPAGSEGS